jgi:regulator of ribonuclease activity A
MPPKTTDLCDACAEAQACELAFESFGRRLAFAGDIRTVHIEHGASVLRDLINQPGDGQVLVIDAGNLAWRAVFGDIMGALAVRNRWAGIVVHGLVRDRIELDAMDIGVKALGTAPRRANLGTGGTLDEPLHFGGITFTPGARLVADADGVIVLPRGLTESDIAVDDAIAATSAYVAGAGNAP